MRAIDPGEGRSSKKEVGRTTGESGMTAYYNEIDEYAAQWLRNLIFATFVE